jgi:hypothetical protein
MCVYETYFDPILIIIMIYRIVVALSRLDIRIPVGIRQGRDIGGEEVRQAHPNIQVQTAHLNGV